MNNLTNSQQIVYDGVISDIKSGTGNILIEGVAGTGKTYLTSKIIDAVKKKNKVSVLAPTHKALKVLLSKIGDIDSGTVHSYLGLKEVITGSGEVTFKSNKYSENRINFYDVCFIDECSMIDDNLLAEIKKSKCQIIFIGDPGQILPVNHDISPVFEDNTFIKYRLDEIVRQKSGSPIIDYATAIRENVEYQGYCRDLVDGDIETFYQGVDTIDSKLVRMFDCDDFIEDSDYSKVVGWTNKTVNHYNKKIREIIFKRNNLEKVIKGEKLICGQPVMRDDDIIFKNNEELDVISVETSKDNMNNKVYQCRVSNGMKTETINVLHEDSENSFNSLLEQMAKKAKETHAGRRWIEWKNFYATKRRYADVRYNYAITAHKSQGSTYENVLILEYDINKNSKIIDRNKIKYTAVTRASKEIYLVI